MYRIAQEPTSRTTGTGTQHKRKIKGKRLVYFLDPDLEIFVSVPDSDKK